MDNSSDSQSSSDEYVQPLQVQAVVEEEKQQLNSNSALSRLRKNKLDEILETI